MRVLVVVLPLILIHCGASTGLGNDASVRDTDPEVSVSIDAAPDVNPDAPRVLCYGVFTLDGSTPGTDGGLLCKVGQICGNSGGVPGNFCCYPTPGMPYYCPD